MNLRELVEGEKVLDARPTWIGDSDPLRFEFTQTISIGAATIGGLILRGKASKRNYDRDIMFQLEYFISARKSVHLWRVCYNPFHNHDNDPIGPEELHYASFRGTHSHGFYPNYIDDENRMRQKNLPLATECIPLPSDFNELLDFCGENFHISNMSIVPPPPWEGSLFGFGL